MHSIEHFSNFWLMKLTHPKKVFWPSLVCLSLLSGTCGKSQNFPEKFIMVAAPADSAKLYKPLTGSTKTDTAIYNKKLLYLAHDKPTSKWPAKGVYPLSGALLPFNRIVTYYGNFYSKGMGILGELEPEAMLAKLQQEVKKWELADTLTPVVPALEYIAVTAQRSPGKDRKYRLRMPFSQIDKTLELAKKINAIVFIDVQTGHSTLQEELPKLLPYLKLPNVHLAIDPEYLMKGKVAKCRARLSGLLMPPISIMRPPFSPASCVSTNPP
jgi:hypothetical protein